MSIKTKMQSLIEAANAETGKSDTDLTAAIQSLINGHGVAVTQISFTIQQNDGGEITDRGTFTVNSGTTWDEWIGSGYTFDDGLRLVVNGGQIMHDEGVYQLQYINDGDPITSTNGRAVSSSDAIISGTTYKLQNLYA